MASDPFGGQSAFPATAHGHRRCGRTRGRRLVTLALILATGVPGALPVHGQQPQRGNDTTIRIVPPVSRALAVDQRDSRAAVQQTSGGVFGGLFGSSGSGNKPKDDGRRAFALPPPDPSTVNWNGVPYHTPAAGPIAKNADGQPVPLRDTARTEPSQTLRPAVTGSVSDSTAARPTNRAVPQPIADAPAPVEVAPLVAPAPRVAALPSPGVTSLQGPNQSDDLSTSTSSRRADRRQITPLSLEPDQPTLLPQADDVHEVVELIPNVDRRAVPELSAVDLSAPDSLDLMAPVNRTAPGKPAEQAKSYPEESIAGQLSPLRPSETADLSPQPTELALSESMAIGSGVASEPTALLAAKPDSPVQHDAVARDQAKPTSSPSAAAATTQARQSVAESETSAIRVTTQGSAEIQINELTQYEIRVENRGSLSSGNITVRTSLPVWAEVVGHDASVGSVAPAADGQPGQWQWQLNSLPVGSTQRLFLRIKPLQSGTFDVSTSWSVAAQTHSAQVTVRQPQLAIEIEGPDSITFGESQTYRVRVLNPGDGLASNIVFTLAPDAEDAVQQPIGNIPAGKEASFEVELTARDLGELRILGAAAGDNDLIAEGQKVVAVVAAKLEATLTGPPLRYQDSEASYQLQVVNHGTAASESVEAEIQIPSGVQYVSGIEGARVQGNRLVWQIASLPAGETLNYEFICQMNETGNHQLRFAAHGTASGQTRVELDTSVVAIADLKLAVFDPQAPAPVGADVTYEVHVNNRGSKAAEDVRVVAQFGHGIEPVRVQGHDGEVVTGQVLFAPIDRIEPGQKVVLKVIAQADKPGDHRFRAEVRSGETVLVAEEATVFVGVSNERISRSSSDSLDR